ncbi:hypothetical protein TNCV_3923931 [Trichonephila clavipes]|nr:hypothetical protein TNCV_3923931 [Trichonephila clavipes]
MNYCYSTEYRQSDRNLRTSSKFPTRHREATAKSRLLSGLDCLDHGWRINGTSATDSTRLNILSTPPFKITNFIMKYYEQTRVIGRGVADFIPDTFNYLKKLAYAILTIFSSTYACESLLSEMNNISGVMKNIKSP